MISKSKTIIKVMDLNSLPDDVADLLNATCDHESVLFVRIDREFYNHLTTALTNHHTQVVGIIESLASSLISEFSFTAQRKPLTIYKRINAKGK